MLPSIPAVCAWSHKCSALSSFALFFIECRFVVTFYRCLLIWVRPWIYCISRVIFNMMFSSLVNLSVLYSFWFLVVFQYWTNMYAWSGWGDHVYMFMLSLRFSSDWILMTRKVCQFCWWYEYLLLWDYCCRFFVIVSIRFSTLGWSSSSIILTL